MDAVDGFVVGHRLHESYPVDLGVMRDLYTVVYAPLSPNALGFALQDGDQGLIGINANLSLPQQRMVLAHEASHLLLDHPNSFYLCEVDQWIYSRYELLAQQAAARILVCHGHLSAMAVDGASTREMADAFEVPEVLIELRLQSVRAA